MEEINMAEFEFRIRASDVTKLRMGTKFALIIANTEYIDPFNL